MTRGLHWLVFVFLALAVCLTLVWLSRRAVDAPVTSDTAVIESYTLLASQGKLMVGAYSRFQWHHPGPLYFYLLAPFYLASGSKAAGLNAGSAAMSIAAIALVVIVLVRRRPSLAVAAGLAMALYAWRASEAAASPWNPHVLVLPCVALIVAAADVAAGRLTMLPVVASLASLIGQAHVALMPAALVLGAGAFAAALLAASAVGDKATASRRSILWTVVVLCVAWALPLIEQLTALPRGNFTEMWRFFAHPSVAGQPLGVAVSAWSDMLVGILRPDFYVAHGWPFVESPVHWAEWLSLSTLAAVALSVARNWRAGERFGVWLGIALIATSAIALWSVTRIGERIFDHDVFWIVGVGLLNLAVSADLILGSLTERLLRRRMAVAACWLLAGASAAACGLEVNRVAGRSRNPPEDARIARALADDLDRFMRVEQVTRPLITIDQDAWGYVAGAILDLQKRGRIVSVEEDWVVMFTPEFRINGREDATIAVAMPPEHLRLQSRGARLISAHEPVYAHVESAPAH